MKKAIPIAIVASFFFFTCKKKCEITTTIVINDCTGTYLRFNGKDNPVCNSRILSGFLDGQIVNVSYKKAVGRCPAWDLNTCQMIHSFDIGEWIEVTKIH